MQWSDIWQRRSYPVRVLFMFHLTCFGWLIFRADSFENLQSLLTGFSRWSSLSMDDAKFEAFAQFAKTITDAKIRLIVIEGESHPDTMNAYPLEFRTETRQRLQSMSEKVGFQYADDGQRPSFDESDWRDAVHLNTNGRRRLTRYVASLIDKNSPDDTRSEQ